MPNVRSELPPPSYFLEDFFLSPRLPTPTVYTRYTFLMLPRELPGLYWDAERNRYFPISSRPPNGPGTAGPSSDTDRTIGLENPGINDDNGHGRRKRQKIELEPLQNQPSNTWVLIDRLRSGATFTSAQRLKHTLELRQISKMHCASVDSVTDGSILSFSAARQPDGSTTAMVGDQHGWVFTHKSMAPQMPTRELFLGAPVSCLIKVGLIYTYPFPGQKCMFKSRRARGSINGLIMRNFFSKFTGFSVEEIDIWTQMRLMGKRFYDVRDAHILDTSLLLGAAGYGILFPDLINSTAINHHVFSTQSDVLSVHQSGQLCFLGCRNGSIQGFDRRISHGSDSNTTEFLNGRFKDSGHAITHLSVVHDWQLLVSTIGGVLETHDIRFSRNRDPLIRFEGHLNKFSEKLGLAISPEHDILFAASDDRKLNAWSLQTGERIAPITNTTQSAEYPWLSLIPLQKRAPLLLKEPFPSDIPALQVTDGGQNHEPCLWVASGKALYKYIFKPQHRH
ncbi:hypothetical protein QCA50_006935 [Cerrena zonata]|uniref:Uncharacterized protein n=1 Tax=Cerrena zonata TaxID=2478898 RepID=A0AAW0GMD8_9APHY